MSASPSRPPVPRPTVRPRSEPAPKSEPKAEVHAQAAEPAPEAPPPSERPSTPKVPSDTVKAYAGTPPVIRERAPTLSLEEDDIVDAAPAETPARASSPPPPPSSRSSAPPPLPPRARSSSVPPPPQSEVRALGAKKISSSPMRVAPVAIVIPPAAPVPTELAPAPVSAMQTAPVTLVQPQVAAIAEPPAAPLTTLPAPPSVAPPAPVAPVVPPPAPVPAPGIVDAHRPSSLVDPTDVLFDTIYDMQFAETSWQAARVCAQALATALRAKAVVVHEHDLVRRELRTIAAHGSGDMDVLGSSAASDDDLVASAVLCNGKPLTMRFDGELPRLAPERLTTIGAQRSLVAVPALSWGRCIAMIEVIDADERLVARVPDATSYVAEHLAAFLSRAAA